MEGGVLERLWGLLVYMDERGEPVALPRPVPHGGPWWVEDRRREHERRRLLEEIQGREQGRSQDSAGAEEARREL